jgi:hypothetical protein
MKKRNVKTEVTNRDFTISLGEIIEVKGRNERDTLFY